MMYKICPHCGSNLDPSETCDCQRQPERREDQAQKDAEQQKEVAQNGEVFNRRA
jgi:hypothetical protein